MMSKKSIKKKVISTQSSRSSSPCPNVSTSHLPRLDPLKFSGKVEEYPEFKRNWLARFGRLENDVQLQYLKPSLPPNDQAKVSAVSTMEVCWTRLGKVYGDKQVNLTTVKNNLKSLVLKGNQRWEKVLQLHDEVEKAVDQLKVINAEDEIQKDYDLVSYLVNKLHVTYQEDWDSYRVDNKNKKPVWQMFVDFLSDKNERATESKMRWMSSKSEQEIRTKCSNKGLDSKSVSSTVVRSHLTLAEITTREQLNQFISNLKVKNGPCPCCNKHHHYERHFEAFGLGRIPTRRLSGCPMFREKTCEERNAFIELINGCRSCLDPKHQLETCKWA